MLYSAIAVAAPDVQQALGDNPRRLMARCLFPPSEGGVLFGPTEPSWVDAEGTPFFVWDLTPGPGRSSPPPQGPVRLLAGLAVLSDPSLLALLSPAWSGVPSLPWGDPEEGRIWWGRSEDLARDCDGIAYAMGWSVYPPGWDLIEALHPDPGAVWRRFHEDRIAAAQGRPGRVRFSMGDLTPILRGEGG